MEKEIILNSNDIISKLSNPGDVFRLNKVVDAMVKISADLKRDVRYKYNYSELITHYNESGDLLLMEEETKDRWWRSISCP